MHDIKYIREFPDKFDESFAKRGIEPISKQILDIDSQKRELTSIIQEKQTERNLLAQQIGELKRSGQDSQEEETKAILIKQEIQQQSEMLDTISKQLYEILTSFPNVLDETVPFGYSDADNVEIKIVGEKPRFSFDPRKHYELGENLGLMDFETASKISGSRFVVLKGPLARLERALAAFMIDSHKELGFEEYAVPFLVNESTVFGTAQLPKFKDDLFQTTDGRWLIPTAEVSLTNTVRDRILDIRSLPIRLSAYTPCFRSEAGAAGRDTVGMIRQHQFSKVELVSIASPEQSAQEHEIILMAAENILKKLGLHYRVITLCSGDTGFSSSKTYDIEVWLPGLGQYKEISSCSNCLGFQARRMNTRYKDENGNNQFVHTLNGSGLAIGRTLVAILENYQNQNGSIRVPDALIDYIGMEEIKNAKIIP